MKTYFVKYLKYWQECLPTENVLNTMVATSASSKSEKATFCLVSSREQVRRALVDNTFSHISRILNDFPIDEEPYPYNRNDLVGTSGQGSQLKSYVERYHRILISGQQLIFDDNTNELRKLHSRKWDEITTFVNDLMLVACEEILDGSGNVRPKIIEILGLQPLVAAWSDKPELQLNLRAQLISAYFSQILWGSIVKNWQDTKAEDYKLSCRDARAPGNLTLFITNTLLGNGSSPAFLKKIASFPLFGRPLTASVAMLLSVMPVQDIIDIMHTDLTPFTPAELAAMPIHLQQDWHKGKVSFWDSVIKSINHYLLQHLAIDRETYLLNESQDKDELNFQKAEIEERLGDSVDHQFNYRSALSEFYQAKAETRAKIYSHACNDLHLRCEANIKDLNAAFENFYQAPVKTLGLFARKQSLPRVANKPIFKDDLTRWLFARDNHIVIQSIISAIRNRKLGLTFRTLVGDTAADFVEDKASYLQLTLEEEKLLQDISQSRFDEKFCTADTSYLLETFQTLCPDGPLQAIIAQYVKALPHPPVEDLLDYYQQRVSR